MANIRSGNSLYIDTVYSAGDEFLLKNVRLLHVIVTTTSAGAGVVILSDSVTGTKKLELRVTASGTTQLFPFRDQAINFPNGIRPTTVTNAVVTCVIEESRG